MSSIRYIVFKDEDNINQVMKVTLSEIDKERLDHNEVSSLMIRTGFTTREIPVQNIHRTKENACAEVMKNTNKEDKRMANKVRGFEVAKGWNDKDITLPHRSTSDSAGYDFHAAEEVTIPSFKPGVKPVLVPTGVKAYMSKGEYLALVNRSSLPLKQGLMLGNNFAVIDRDYYSNEGNDGHIMFQFWNFSDEDITIEKDTRIGQGIFHSFAVADDDSAEGERQGGFGSTGTN